MIKGDNKMSTMFENAKVGDKVFSHTLGWGEIERISRDTKHPINVRFSLDNSTSSFTVEGYRRADLPVQSLFWNYVHIEAPTKPIIVKTIHGVEVPDLSFHPTDETDYYYPATNDDMFDTTTYYNEYTSDRFRSTNNLCYPYTEEGKQAAILHAKAMLGITE
jgi:hypothetical protein